MSKPLHLLPGSAELRQLLPRIGALRVHAWAHDGVTLPNSAGGLLLDQWDERAEHWVVSEAGELIAASRLTVHDGGDALPDGTDVTWTGRLGMLTRLVVAPAARRRGLGQQLTEVRLQRASALGCESMLGVTSSKHRRVASLMALGFVISSSTVSQVTGLPGQVLRKQLR